MFILMNYYDIFKPYSLEIHGDLSEYLKEHDGFSGASNYFYGPKYFFIVKDMGLIIPEVTFVRVNRSPIPDISYFVNSEYLLQSNGPGPHNMSCIGAKKGIYDPRKALRNKGWSISHLRIE